MSALVTVMMAGRGAVAYAVTLLAALLVTGVWLPPVQAQQADVTPPQGQRSPRGAPEILLKKLERKRQKAAKPGNAYRQPGEAHDFFVKKRVPVGETALPVERYLKALERMKQMPQHSTRTNSFHPSRRETGFTPDVASSLGTWTPLGPGNIGGRTRAILINPSVPTTMYAAGVAGGVWKTTNGGTTWTPLTDLIANLAVNSMAMDPTNSSVIYAGTGEGYFNVDAVRGAGIFKTTDGGANWNHLANTNNSNFHYVNKIVVSPNNAQRVYAATRTGVWRSTDGGTNWTQVHNPGVTGGCLDLVIRTDQATDYMFASCGTNAQATIYRKTDAEAASAWTAVFTEAGMGRTSLAIAPSQQGTIYAVAASIVGGPGGNYNGGLHAVFRSLTNGDSGTWTAQVRNTNATKLNTVLLTNTVYAFLTECSFGASQFFNQGWYDNVIAVDPLDPNRVWVGGIDLFRSDDGGMNWGMASHWWAATSNPRYAHADQHAIVFHPQYNGTTNKTMFVGDDGGLFRTNDAHAATATGATAPCSTNNGSVNWTELNNNYSVTQFYHGVPYPGGTTYFGGTQDNGTVRGSDSAGSEVWSTILGGDGGYVAVDPGNTNILYAENTGLSIQKSTNGGTSFSSATSGITEASSNFLFITSFIMDPSSSQRLWTGGWFLWRTDNAAGIWSGASAITAGAGSVSAIAVAPTNANNVLAGMSDGFIHRTSVGLTSTSTTSWPFVQPRTGYVSWVTFDPTNANIAYATYSTFGGTHVWKSIDAGATWTGIDGSGSTGIPDIPVHSIVVDPNSTSRLYVGTDLGVFVSRDGGVTWAVEVTGFANVITEALAVTSVGGTPNIFAFTHGRGTWRVSTTDVTPPPQQFTLTVTMRGSAPGTVTSNPAGITCTIPGTCIASYASDTVVTLTEAPGSGASFKQWGGACSGTATTCMVTMNANQTVTATFSQVFTDPTLTAQSTLIKAVHVTELRSAINTLRAVNSLSAFSWTDPTLTAGTTPAKKVHMDELRQALNEAYQAAGQSAPSYTDPTIVAQQTMIKASHVSELRTAVRVLE